MSTYAEETRRIARERAQELRAAFIAEVDRLLRSGAVSDEGHHRGMVFGIALENIADNYLRGDRQSKEYKNLKRF